MLLVSCLILLGSVDVLLFKLIVESWYFLRVCSYSLGEICWVEVSVIYVNVLLFNWEDCGVIIVFNVSDNELCNV